jgi:hypothetical protein|tara:strand:+ start:85 stop:318 length:234 start_codon:yes stop_codon:yes gene_type:complete
MNLDIIKLDDIGVRIDFALRNSDTFQEFREICVDAFLNYGEVELGINQGTSAEIFMANDYDSELLELWNRNCDKYRE